ncbi:DUF4054 domain-containing protein [Acetobacter sicerae]|uniref:DUF4054 domain-containing protein n=1 Tax=Acetobacter sicerae TaxID=85325 RepID=UPI0038D0105B
MHPNPHEHEKEITPCDFLGLFPEFSDTASYPPCRIETLIHLGRKFVSAERWQDSYRYGVCLVTAHQLVLSQQAARSAAVGATPGMDVGIVTSKSVGSVSKSMDASIGSVDGAGPWNMTIYGRQYWQLVQIYGSGGMQF